MNNTSYMTLGQAAKAVGKSKPTISKYIKNGKLSIISKDESGYQIDPSELYRVFPLSSKENSKHLQSLTPELIGDTRQNTPPLQMEIEILKVKLDAETKRANALETEKEDWKKQAQTLLLKSPEKPPYTRKGFWATILGKTD